MPHCVGAHPPRPAISFRGISMFYGWKLLAAISFCYLVGVGTCLYGFSVALPALLADLGWSRSEASLGFSILMLTWGISAPGVAALINRTNTRTTFLIGGACITLGASITYFTSSLPVFYIGTGLIMGAGLSMTTVLPGTHLLAHWFVRRRALAMGLFMANGGLGAFFIAPAMSQLIAATGDWRVAWLCMAISGVVVGLVGYLVIRETPAEMGQHADGAAGLTAAAPAGHKVIASAVYKTDQDWVLKDALATRFFWLIVFVACVATSASAVVNAHLILHLTDIGISSLIAASALGVLGILNTAGRVLGGGAGDRLDPRWLLGGGMALQAGALLVLITSASEFATYAFAAMFGFGFGIYLVAMTTLVANYFGSAHYASIAAIQGLAYTVVAASGPLVAGLLYDQQGSYQISFWAFCALSVVAAGAVAAMRPPEGRSGHAAPSAAATAE